MKTIDILERLPHRSFKYHGAFHNYVRRMIEAAGERPLIARYDTGGNCLYCGEAGRCPGWHTEEEVLPIQEALQKETSRAENDTGLTPAASGERKKRE